MKVDGDTTAGGIARSLLTRYDRTYVRTMGIELFETVSAADDGGAELIKSEVMSLLGECLRLELRREGGEVWVGITIGDSVDNTRDIDLDDLEPAKTRILAEAARFCEVLDKFQRDGIAVRAGIPMLRAV
ncbi:hypothetical protein ACFRAQ_34480 [Nocardia sp. NPDC056611]|uniref:hypothetical protein n=1 Tax=Nocardia sp. NPDC056611 TaxID=3345877 RepID=UPI00366B234F